MKTHFLNLLICTVFILFSSHCHAEITEWVDKEHSKIRSISDKDFIAVQIKLDNGWKTFSDNPGDLGMPTYFDYSESKNLEKIEVLWPPTQEQEVSGLKNSYYEGNIYFPIRLIPIDPNKPVDLKLHYSFSLCKNLCLIKNHLFSQIINIDKSHSSSAQIIKEVLLGDALEEPQPHTLGTTLLYALFCAFIGGLILNIMPCVLPVLSIKLLGIIKHSNATTKEIRLNFLSTIIGILFSFWIFASLAITLRLVGYKIGIGFHFQNPYFLIGLVLILITFASNMLGSFEVQTPMWVNNIASKNSRGYLGSFLSGAFATILATPCTAPFVSIAVAYALSASAMDIFLIFTSLAIGFSFPYVILMIAPSLIRVLPSPGQWMENFKKFLGILLLGTAMWLIYVLYFQLGFMPTIVLFLLLMLLKFVLDRNDHVLSRSSIKIIAVLIIVGLSFTLPFIKEQEIEAEEKIADSVWQPLDLQKIPQLIEKNYIVVVDITAKWCITCQINKAIVLDRSDIIQILKQKNIVAMRASLTKDIPPEIYAYMKKIGRPGIPINVVYGPSKPKGILLREIFYPSDLKKAIEQASLKYSDLDW